MKTGYRIELTVQEMNTILTAFSARATELAAMVERSKTLDGPGSYSGRKYLEKELKELTDIWRKLENAEYFIETGA